jgi:DNA-binding IclR family transcriptional regulator
LVQSIFRACDILNCLCNDINTVTEISGNCNLSVATTYRILKALEKKDLVYQDPRNKKYYLGYFITKLSLNPIPSHKYLVMLAEEETTRLSKLNVAEITLYIHPGGNNKMLRILEIRNNDDFSRMLIENRILPALSGCAAEVLLSQFNDKELAVMLKDVNIPPLTENTITDPEQLVVRVKEVRRLGFSCTIGQRIIGALGIAVPVNNYLCPVALELMGNEFSLKSRVPELLQELQVSAKRISDNLKRTVNLKV